MPNISRRDLLFRATPAAMAAALAGGALKSFAGMTSPFTSSVREYNSSLMDLAAADVCTLTCAQTLGPCYYNSTTVRQDITEGEVGLPTLLAFLVVNADTCQPIANASVDIWHTNARGVYSAPINQMCNPGDALARTKTFTRGVQFTDASGWAYFNTLFPGWYSGRTVHIHATIRVSGTAMVTTQFYFDDTLTDYIFANDARYAGRGNRDTRNTSDNILGGSLTRMSPFLFKTKLFRDRSLVARKVIALRSTPTTCNA